MGVPGREVRSCDVAVIGAGVAGTVTAACLARSGFDVALIDAMAVHPPEFRAEKLGPEQMALFHRLGAGKSVRAVATPVGSIDVVRYGRIHERERRREYGFTYASLVNQLRADLPGGLTLEVGRVEIIEPGPTGTRVVLTDGSALSARLVVVATGLGDAVRRKVGLTRTTVSQRHSLSVGFDLEAPLSRFPFEALTYYGETFGDRVAYLTLFPIETTMRANLFVYRGPADDWVRSFRTNPVDELGALLPRLRRFCPDLSTAGPVEIRSMDLIRVEDPARDGVVLVGDAYQTTCPIPGNGIGKVLVDVERLVSFVPKWLAQPCITKAMVTDYYADPVKASSDALALRSSLYARSLALEAEGAWRLRRLRNTIARHALHGLYLAGRRHKQDLAVAGDPVTH
jgi:2-polyprenyl-6-methoxyphenol hydroxylase-like FAD-dependent oxidoreductase